MNFFSLLIHDPVTFAIVAGILLYSIIAHELAHGAVALLFGDDTAKVMGRLTLNPASHIDPIGTLMLFIAGFGWAKPVPVNYYKLSNFRFGLVSVALAGCCANILIAIIALGIETLLGPQGGAGVSGALEFVARINIILGAFNLIPIPPLDGSKVLMAVLPREMQESLAKLEPYGFFILAFFILTGLLNPVIAGMQNTLYSMIAHLFGAAR
ncbi:MAG TPA: site-2 protease family protein [Chitinivibrionales bacterium]|nr:site-2 protease family protein [Chitinivibrionales bacterium]